MLDLMFVVKDKNKNRGGKLRYKVLILDEEKSGRKLLI